MDSSSTNTETDVFKKPTILPGKIQPKLLEQITVSEDKSESTEEPSEKAAVPKLENASELKPSKVNISTAPIPYSEPSWGGLSDTLYTLEEMKSGVSLRMISLDQRSFYCFGRLENCHIVMAHPTVSRYHAIIQFRSTFNADDERKGFYLFDMGSTHGTFLNKERIAPKTYVKVQVGHIIKFGSSTRFFLLHGPEDDKEDESTYSYSELVEIRKKEIEEKQNAYLEKLTKSQSEEESKGIDWGMGEDADEETDLMENPFATTANEELYREDPKKILRNWFERQGEEFKFNVEEKGFGHFRCTIKLPVDYSDGFIAESVVSGKKKEAIFQCALEACRILDRNGLLKQNNNESKKRKIKNWEEQDFYDSDEDSFFDRTGDLEQKRKQRMIKTKNVQNPADTYDTLIEKHKIVLKEIEEVESKLSGMTSIENFDLNDDNLDSFTSHKTSGQLIDKLELRRSKNLLTKLKNDENRLRKLINFVKPFELPVIKPPEIKPIPVEPAEKQERIKEVPEPISEPIVEKNPKETEVEKNIARKQKIVSSYNVSDFLKSSKQNLNERKDSHVKEVIPVYVNQLVDDFNNIEWAPPSNQTGDGRTSLNDKLGY